MPAAAKPQRVRDPLHDLIEFGTGEFEQMLWQLIQTPEFQRLRRIKQLGFSEYVYPGATHTRFAHSIGVFHTARQLMTIIETHLGNDFDEERANDALAAALLHDVGHGPFSHAFEAVGAELDLKYTKHEQVSQKIIVDSGIEKVLNSHRPGMAERVARIVSSKGSPDIYYTVVSSQCDADRLDYMQRDRLMAGTRLAAIDFTWLKANLEIGEIPDIVEGESAGNVQTFVFGEKAIHAAEDYVLALFQLYPTVYFHKTTRSAEKVFSHLFMRLHKLVMDEKISHTGLSKSHPMVAFCKHPKSLEYALRLDDTMVMGALGELSLSKDPQINHLAVMLKDRKLPMSIDIRAAVIDQIGNDDAERVDTFVTRIAAKFREQSVGGESGTQGIWIDRGFRPPYERIRESSSPLDQIRINKEGSPEDIGDVSPIVKAIPTFKFDRIYIPKDDRDTEQQVLKTIHSISTEARGP